MGAEQEVPRVVSASREIAADKLRASLDRLAALAERGD